MKCFHVHYLIRASATEACARQGGWSHHWAERDTAQWRSLQAPRTLRKKEFFLVEGLRRCVLEGDVTKVLEAGATPWGWEGFATRGTEEGWENGQVSWSPASSNWGWYRGIPDGKKCVTQGNQCPGPILQWPCVSSSVTRKCPSHSAPTTSEDVDVPWELVEPSFSLSLFWPCKMDLK